VDEPATLAVLVVNFQGQISLGHPGAADLHSYRDGGGRKDVDNGIFAMLSFYLVQ